MKMKQIYVSMVIVVMTTMVVTSAGRPQMWTTPGYPGENLSNKMFTLSRDGGRVRFYPPSFSMSPPPATSTPSTRRPTWPTHTWPAPTWPAPTPSARGVSVCLRFLTDSYLSENFPLFSLGASRSALQVDVGVSGVFRLSFGSWGHDTVYLKPNVKFWSSMWPDLWTSICVTVDPLKNVAQVFSGSFMSIRKLIPGQSMWSGEPVVSFSGFDGQLTDLQVWDSALHYREVYSYMQWYRFQGSVLTWSRIRYDLQGNALLEDTFELQGKQPMSRQGRGQKGRKRFSTRREGKRQQL